MLNNYFSPSVRQAIKRVKKNKNFPRPLYRLRKRGQTSAAMPGEFTPPDAGAEALRRVTYPGCATLSAPIYGKP